MFDPISEKHQVVQMRPCGTGPVMLVMPLASHWLLAPHGWYGRRSAMPPCMVLDGQFQVVGRALGTGISMRPSVLEENTCFFLFL